MVCFHDQVFRSPRYPVLRVLLRFGHTAPTRWRSSTPSFSPYRLSDRSPASKAQHLQQDFDTGTHLAGIYLYVTEIPFHLSALYPIAAFAIRAQSKQNEK